MSGANRTATASSFRDPDGFVFLENGIIYRQVNSSYKVNYDFLIHSGLYKSLVEKNLLISHEEYSGSSKVNAAGVYKVLLPQQIPFISYPHEWSFGQLKDAAILTIQIQQIAFEHGMSLKDASAYNVQFLEGKPVFIDTLSFEKYNEGAPWNAFGQFCRHFLAPLALRKYTDGSLGQLSRIYMDGIPLNLASKLLPFKTYFNFNLLSNIHLHARSERHFSDKKSELVKRKVSKNALRGIFTFMESFISALDWKPQGTQWSNYYSETNYSDNSRNQKKEIVSDYLEKAKPKAVLDLGANDGTFSRIASSKGIFTISADNDFAAVEKNYRKLKEDQEINIFPIWMDLSNPTSSFGWNYSERASFNDRVHGGLVMMLALIHHLVISNNLPFQNVIEFLLPVCDWVIIEFVPKSDSQVQWMLQGREDVFHHYTIDNFEKEFSRFFQIHEKKKIEGTERVIFLMKKR